MSRALPMRALLGAAVLAAASMASAQFVDFTRCQAAYPCNVPFSLQYKPDPLIAGQFTNVQTNIVSGHIDIAHPLQPALDLSKELGKQDFAKEAARVFVLRHPLRKPTTTPPADAAPTPARTAPD